MGAVRRGRAAGGARCGGGRARGGAGRRAAGGGGVAALLGWWFTPAVVTGSWRRALAIGLGSGLVAPLLGLLAIVYGIVVTGLAGGPQEAGNGLVGAIFVGLYGLAYCFVVLPVTIPSGIAWTVIARGLRPWLRVRPGDDRHLAGLEVVVVVLVLVAVGALLVPLGEPAVP